MTRSDHAINGKMFNRLNKVSKEHEVELAKSNLYHRENIKVGLFTYQ